MATSTVENYLKQLYLEQVADPSVFVPMGRLATLMNVVPGTATAMVKTLADSGLVNYSPRTGVHLTEAGRRIALHVLRRHRLVELFLVKIVGLDWSEVHAEAEELEHVVSEKLLDRMDELLGRPATDPHGDPIPTASGEVPAGASENFVTCPLGEKMEITRILDQEPQFLQFAMQRSLIPGTHFRVQERNAQAESVTLSSLAGTITLSTGAAAKFVVRCL